MKHLIRTITLFMLCISFTYANAQDIPEIGKPCPQFTLSQVTHYSKSKVNLNDFKGKWLILDFWFTGCTACIKSFPKISSFQEEFQDKVQFLMVGTNDKRFNANIEEVFEKLRKKQGFKLAAAYDSVLNVKWKIHSMPHLIIIDPKGIVRHISTGEDLTRQKISDLINEQEITLWVKDSKRKPFSPKLVTIENTPYENKLILCNSILTKWNGEEINPGFEIDRFPKFKTIHDEGFKLAGVTLQWLYSTAYLGKSTAFTAWVGDPEYGSVFSTPILEVKDSSFFNYNLDDGSGIYNYKLVVPKNVITTENLMRYMQQDLERVFPFIATIEQREMPVWNLIATPDAENKIKTKGGARYYDAEEGLSIVAGFSVRNVAMKDYIMYLTFYLDKKYAYLDETNIKYNIDLTIDADLTNMEDLKKALQRNGLDLVLGTKKMKVLVIRDAKPETSTN